jgi:hypothetical protein
MVVPGESIVLDIGSTTMLSPLAFASSFSGSRRPPFGTTL